MEEKHTQILELHRAKFVKAVDVERLYPILQGADVLGSNDMAEINQLSTRESKVETLLDLLPSKGSQAFQTLCVALEPTYPHLLTAMCNQSVTDSRSTSLTSDSEEDTPQSTSHDLGEESSQVKESFQRSNEYDLQENNVSLLKAELKYITHERDELKGELNRVSTKMEDYKKRVHGLVMEGGRQSERSRDYDWLKLQCERAMRELQSLKSQHQETVKRCDQSVKEADFLRQKNKTTLDKLDKTNSESLTWQAKYNEMMVESERWKKEIEELHRQQEEDKREMADLRQQQRDYLSESGSNEVLHKLYDSALDKYDTVTKEHDDLRKNFVDLTASHNALVSKLNYMQEENNHIKKQYDEVCAERTNIMLDRDDLRQQCTTAIMKWTNDHREKNEYKERLQKMQMERDKYRNESASTQLLKQNLTKDLARMKKERDDAVQEYHLIMSERDSVHKEIEQLQDKLNDNMKKYESLQTANQAISEELQTLQRDRDQALKECNGLREKCGDVINEKEAVVRERDKLQRDFEALEEERDIARRERQQALEERDNILRETYEKTQKEIKEEKVNVSKETEALRKNVDKLNKELADSLQECEVSKLRRDWAFSERDKIVQERESIRTLCDKLRRERDRAVSELAEALRDSDDLKKQRNTISKETKELRRKYEELLEKENRKNQLNSSVGHNHSRDSAIDTDMHEWETETLEFDIGSMNDDNLGFGLLGGKDDPQAPNDNSIFVGSVQEGSTADGKLRVNDQLLKVNNVDVTNVEKKIAIQALRSGGGTINMVVRRRRSTTSSRVLHPVHVTLSGGKEFGIELEHGVQISRIFPGSPASKQANLSVGDRILSVNGRSTENCTKMEVMKLIEESGESIVLHVQKSMPTSQASLMDSMMDQTSSLGSPRSPHSADSPSPVKNYLWHPVESPDAKQQQQQLKALKSSGSQTDSLDSPSGGSSNKNKHSSHYDNIIVIAKKFLPSSRSRHERERKHERERLEKEEQERQRQRNRMIEHLTPAEELSIAQLDSVLDAQAPDAAERKSSSHRRKEDNAGTWPKCGPAPLNNLGLTVTRKQKERQPVRSWFNENGTAPNYNTYQPPPTPPERGNSSSQAFIRHSPSNSDASVKYAEPSSKPSSYMPLQNVMPGQNNCGQNNCGQNNCVNNNNKDIRAPTAFNVVLPKHYPTSSTPAPTSDYDHSIKSTNKESDIYRHFERRARNRPRSAEAGSSSRRQEQLERARLIHGPLRQPIPQKPQQLNLYPVYPPRPLGHTGSHSGERLTSRTPMSPVSPGGLQGMQHQQHQQSLYKAQTPHSVHATSVRSSEPVPVYMVKSQPLISSTSPVSMLTHHPLTSVSSPRHSSPVGVNNYAPPGRSREPMHMTSSIPEMDNPSDRLPGSISLSPSPSPYSQLSTSTSGRATPTAEEFTYNRVRPPAYHPGRHHDHDTNTFPRRIHQHPPERMRIPSNPSVSGRSWVSESDRSSPSPFIPVVTSRSSTSSITHSLNNQPARKKKRPRAGEMRTIAIEKGNEQLGISIRQIGSSGGIFVESVGKDSLAARECIEVGDQLLEVCGVNMRNATYNQAATVLRQAGDRVNLLVQYNLNKYKEGSGDVCMDDDDDDDDESASSSSGESDSSETHETSHNKQPHLVSNETITSCTPTNTPRASGIRSNPPDLYPLPCEPRFVFLKKTTANPGIGLVGGNAVGIFVSDVLPDSVASGPDGLRCGDQLLEVNGSDLRSATAEQAAYEISKPEDKITILAQYNVAKYNKIKQDQSGDSFFIRSLFDRQAGNEGEISFKKDDILYIDNTLPNGQMNLWRAWLVDDEGNKLSCGLIPSKTRMEEELIHKRSLMEASQEDELNKSSRRGSAASVRRSLFRRRRHQRNNSKDSRELPSFSDASINSDSVPILDDGSVLTYLRVDRFTSKTFRPVLILGPLAGPIINKLAAESPDRYQKLNLNTDIVTESDMSMIKKLSKDHYCMLESGPSSVERLHRGQIYPIIIFIKHKSSKQIRDVKDTQFLKEKISNKAAKELHETFQRIEADFRHLFSVVIEGGNLAIMCLSIKSAIANEQKKTLWVPGEPM